MTFEEAARNLMANAAAIHERREWNCQRLFGMSWDEVEAVLSEAGRSLHRGVIALGKLGADPLKRIVACAFHPLKPWAVGRKAKQDWEQWLLIALLEQRVPKVRVKSHGIEAGWCPGDGEEGAVLLSHGGFQV